MNVPAIHYVFFWFMNSLMALGTGFILGLIVLRVADIVMSLMALDVGAVGGVFLFTLVAFPLGLLCIYQIFIASFFWGKRRGEFEYSFLEKTAERGKVNPELGICLKEVKHELRFGDPDAAHLKLNIATKLFPDSFVIYFKYAISCEIVGLSDDAIAAYTAAEKLLPKSVEALITYVEKQIARVKLKGPTKRSSAPGLQYMIY